MAARASPGRRRLLAAPAHDVDGRAPRCSSWTGGTDRSLLASMCVGASRCPPSPARRIVVRAAPAIARIPRGRRRRHERRSGTRRGARSPPRTTRATPDDSRRSRRRLRVREPARSRRRRPRRGTSGRRCLRPRDRPRRAAAGWPQPSDARIGTRDSDAEDVQEARCRIDCDDLRRDRREMSRELPGPRAQVERDARPQPGQERLDLWRPLRSTRLVVETAVAAAPLRHDGDSGSFHTSASASRPRRRRTLA